MKIIVDETPYSCHECVFGIDQRPSCTVDIVECNILHKQFEVYSIPVDCPLVSLKDILNIDIDFNDDYEGKYCEVKIKLGEQEVAKCRDNIRWSFK